MPTLTRRTMLRLGAGAAAGIAGEYTLGPLLQLGMATAVGAPPSGEPRPPSKAAETFLTGSFVSAARGGKDTQWAIARPPGQVGVLHPVIALHGRNGSASGVMGMGIEAGLAQVVEAGYPPFAVVSVDGGDGWWHPRASGEDSGAMVLTELLPMLAAKGLDTTKVGFIGWSMGGYGALLLGGMLGPARTAAICAVSPALYTSYDKAVEAGAFDSPADWRRYSVFGAPALSKIPLRVDCGANDRFYLATKQFVASLRRPPSGVSFAGGHDISAWRQKLPVQLAWLAS
jgi:pimeloyl-ACP methyl ester carboxylesterase